MKNLLRSLGFLFLGLILVQCTKNTSTSKTGSGETSSDAVVAEIGTNKITYKELLEGIETDVHELDKRKYELLEGKLKHMALEKIIMARPDRENLSVDEYVEKKIGAEYSPTEQEIVEFAKAKFIPTEELNEDLKKRIAEYMKMEKKHGALEKWLEEQMKTTPVKLLLPKPVPSKKEIALGNSPLLGEAKAKIKIVEFSDFECPFCASASKIVKEIKEKYKEKVVIAFKHFPLPSHTRAKIAAQYSLCVFKQEGGSEKFWAYHDLLFDNQKDLSDEKLLSLSEQVGVNKEKVKQCVDTNETLAQVEEDMKQGNQLKIQATPTFFVNGVEVRGASSIQDFTEIIEKELAL